MCVCVCVRLCMCVRACVGSMEEKARESTSGTSHASSEMKEFRRREGRGEGKSAKGRERAWGGKKDIRGLVYQIKSKLVWIDSSTEQTHLIYDQ